jgi:hypothetical protein
MEPAPIDRQDGGADFKREDCEDICYSVNAEGMCLEQCDLLEVPSLKCKLGCER